VIAHSKSLPLLIEALGGERIPDVAESDYDHIYMLIFAGLPKPTLVRLRFGADLTSAGAHASSLGLDRKLHLSPS
jgi:hypothetical protein